MKNKCIGIIIALLVLSISDLYAGNQSNYTTIHQPYTIAPSDKPTYAFGISYDIQIIGYIPFIRMFIPPGTVDVYLEILEYGNKMAMSRYNLRPVSELPSSTPGVTKPYTLSDLTNKDCLSAPSIQSNMLITHDVFLSPGRSVSEGGWLYVHIGGGTSSPSYHTDFSVIVNTEAYNNWWKSYGSNSDKSINWDKDVESVITYNATPAPLTPGKPTVTPASGSVFNTSQARIDVTCSKATQIYYSITSSTDGSLPEDPSYPLQDPLTSVFKGEPINGSGETGYLYLPIPKKPQLKTMYKIMFQGLNSHGNGEVSDVLQYTVYGEYGDIIKRSDAATAPEGTVYNDLIRTPKGLIDPGQKFLLSNTGSNYSANDLISEWLKNWIPDVISKTKKFESGNVTLISANSLGNFVLPLLVETVQSTIEPDDTTIEDVFKDTPYVLSYNNIKLTFNLAGYEEDQLTKLIKSGGLNMEYIKDHIGLISSISKPNVSLLQFFGFGAKCPSTPLTGETCNVAQVDENTFTVTYGDGTTQTIFVYVRE